MGVLNSRPWSATRRQNGRYVAIGGRPHFVAISASFGGRQLIRIA
jgi:hypothetical protein